MVAMLKRLPKWTPAARKPDAKQYMAKTEPYRKLDRPFFIDKNPANFLHVGLIKALFPER